MIPSLFTLFLAPAIAKGISLEYYRSASCDTQSSSFFLGSHKVAEPLLKDTTCHQTPARTMELRLNDDLDPACVVLAYEDYGCTNLVGSIPRDGKCIAATKAKIGSWQMRCDDISDVSATSSSTTYAPGELKRRGRSRLPSIRDIGSPTTEMSVSHTVTLTVVASSVASEVSSEVNASASKVAAAIITSSPSEGAVLSLAIKSGTDIDHNLTSYVTAAPNSSHPMSTLKTIRPSSTITFTGTRSSNGTAVLHVGGSPSNQPDAGRIIMTALCGALAILVAVVV